VITRQTAADTYRRLPEWPISAKQAGRRQHVLVMYGRTESVSKERAILKFGGTRVGVMLERGFIIGVLSIVLSACAVVDPVHPRSDTIDRSLEEARNKSILLNIIRASHQWPLNFTAIAQVSPSMSNQTMLGLPDFLVGPNPVPSSPGRDVIFGSSSLSDSLMVSSNFSVTSLNTGTFYQGLLQPVSLHDLNYFIRQNYSRELLFWLFADTVELIRGPDVIGYHYDPPKDYGCARDDPKQRCFREWAEIAVITGLTVEDRTVLPKGDGKTVKIYSRFCFDPVLAREGEKAMDPARRRTLESRYLDIGLTHSPRCGEPWNPGAKGEEERDTLNFHLGSYTFKILPRSTKSIYQFLGQLLGQQRDHILPPEGAYIPRLEEAEPPTLSTEPNNPELLTIVPEQPGVQCFVHTYFFDGDYCVPEYGAANTKRIFSLLAELLALKTMANELAITPLVRIIP
jgi:hypothetical protein